MLKLWLIYSKIRRKLFFLILSKAVHFFKVGSIISDIIHWKRVMVWCTIMLIAEMLYCASLVWWDLHCAVRLVSHNYCTWAPNTGCEMCYFTSPIYFPLSANHPLCTRLISCLHLSSTWFLIPTLRAHTSAGINISATLMREQCFTKTELGWGGDGQREDKTEGMKEREG